MFDDYQQICSSIKHSYESLIDFQIKYRFDSQFIIEKMKQIFHEAKGIIDSYQLIRQRQSITKRQSVKKLEDLIFKESLIRMHLQLAISNCPQTLAGRSINDLLDLLNVGLHEPVSFTFYPLVGSPLNSIFCELMQTQNGRILFSKHSFNSSIRDILNDYNQMLKSQISLKYLNEEPPLGWMCPEAQKHINYHDFQCDRSKPHYGFRSWNDFFTRKLKKGARPIFGEGTANARNIVTHSCQAFPLQNPLMPVKHIKKVDRFWLKDQDYSLKDIFGASRLEGEYYSSLFEGGIIYQGFLDVFYYHCWHSPVDGEVQANYLIQGHYFVDKSQFTVRELDSFKVCQSYLSSVATRRIIVINADNPLIGKVALVFIGMADISSCVSHVQKGQRVEKGQYLGQFQIGGSSHAIIFQKKANLKFNQHLYDSNKKAKLQRVNSFLAQLL